MNPKYHTDQVMKITREWGKDIPPRPIIDVVWDAGWGCYTYSFPFSAIRIQENQIFPSGDPDITSEKWIDLQNAMPAMP